MKTVNIVHILTKTALHCDEFKLSLYNGVFSYSQLAIILIEYNGFDQFCSGCDSGMKIRDPHSGGPLTYILGVRNQKNQF